VLARTSLRAAALLALLAVLLVLGAHNVQIVSFHVFFGVLVISIAAVLLIFAMTADRDETRTEERHRHAAASGGRER
jgi:hypothetical protein